MITYQDFKKVRGSNDVAKFIGKLIDEHEASEMVKTARIADEYDHQRNTTIREYSVLRYTAKGSQYKDFTKTPSRIASNFFNLLNTRLKNYSLGNGVTFTQDNTKDKLGKDFDTVLSRAGYDALIHGVSFILWNFDRAHVFPLTEFAPLWDETSGALRAGVRYWRIAEDKPIQAVLYEEDGYTRYAGESSGRLTLMDDKRAYKQRVSRAPADMQDAVVGEENYSALPIVTLWGSRLHQSTLVGNRQAIDSYDLVFSGFADDLKECAQIYWLIENYGGMSADDVQAFLDQMTLTHAASADTQNGGRITPYTQEVPHQSRSAYLSMIRTAIYESFGVMDTASIAAGNKTATEINAAYQAMDDKADDFEYQIGECVQKLLALQGIEDYPQFKRNRISNQYEHVQMVMLEAEYLDEETVLKKLPNVTPDEVEGIMQRKAEQERSRFVRDEQTGGADTLEEQT